MASPDDADLLDLQARLRADADGTERRSLEQRLEAMHHAAKRRLDAGVTTAEFGALNGLLDATQAAGEVIGSVWRRFHPAGGVR